MNTPARPGSVGSAGGRTASADRAVGSWLLRGIVVCGLFGWATCAHLMPPGTACRSDNDCKLDRICDAGRCVWPARTATGPAAAAPETPAPEREPTPPAAAAATTSAPAAATAETPAPAIPAVTMFRFEPSHKGRSPHRLSARRPSVKWTYETRGPIFSSPAISPAGFVVVGSHDGRVHLVGKDGKPIWVFSTQDMVFGSPAIGGNGTIYIGSDDDHLYALDPKERREGWRFRMGACRSGAPGPDNSRCDADGGPTIGPDGTLYAGGDAVYALNPNGSLRWRYATGGHVGTAPALLADGTVVVGSQDNMVHAISPNGGKRWDFRTGDDVESTPSVGDDGTIYVGSDDGKVYALNPDGALRWAFHVGDDVRASPAVGPGGSVYVGSLDGVFYAIRPDGTAHWTFRAGDRILSSALVDAGGAVLFGAEDDRLYALESNGHLRWSVELGGDIDSSPVLSPDGTIYVGADDRKLYALR